MEATDQDRARLGHAVKRRREFRRLSIDAAAATAPMSPVTWSNVEKGVRVRGLTYAGIERALGWTSGSAEQILAGGEPTEIQAQAGSRRLPAGFDLRDEYLRIRELTVSCETKLALLGEIIELYVSDLGEALQSGQDRSA